MIYYQNLWMKKGRTGPTPTDNILQKTCPSFLCWGDAHFLHASTPARCTLVPADCTLLAEKGLSALLGTSSSQAHPGNTRLSIYIYFEFVLAMILKGIACVACGGFYGCFILMGLWFVRNGLRRGQNTQSECLNAVFCRALIGC
jgi:hypothetical protein